MDIQVALDDRLNVAVLNFINDKKLDWKDVLVVVSGDGLRIYYDNRSKIALINMRTLATTQVI